MTLHRRSPLRRGVPLATSPLTRGAQPLRKAVKPLTSRTATRRLYEAELAAMRSAVADRSLGVCEAKLPGCRWFAVLDDNGDALNVHHRRERSAGGGNDLANLLHCCASCHPAGIHEHPARAYELGLLVHSWQDPADIPINRGAA